MQISLAVFDRSDDLRGRLRELPVCVQVVGVSDLLKKTFLDGSPRIFVEHVPENRPHYSSLVHHVFYRKYGRLCPPDYNLRGPLA